MSLLLTGCAQWKTDGQSTKQKDLVYTGMFFDENQALTVGYSGLIRFSKDGGKNWLAGTNRSMCLYGCNILDEKTFFATGNGKQVIISKDAGDTWGRVTDIGGSSPKGKSISFSSATDGWVSSKTWLGETTDGGKTWSQIPLPEGVSLIETVCTTKAGTGYAVSGEKELFRTTDSGKTWEKLTSPFTAISGAFKPMFAVDNQGIALSMKGDKGIAATIGRIGEKQTLMICTTLDGGKTWLKAEAHALKSPPRSVNVSPKEVVSVFGKDTVITRFSL